MITLQGSPHSPTLPCDSHYTPQLAHRCDPPSARSSPTAASLTPLAAPPTAASLPPLAARPPLPTSLRSQLAHRCEPHSARSSAHRCEPLSPFAARPPLRASLFLSSPAQPTEPHRLHWPHSHGPPSPTGFITRPAVTPTHTHTHTHKIIVVHSNLTMSSRRFHTPRSSQQRNMNTSPVTQNPRITY